MCVGEKITPDLFVVRRAVNILNKHTIRWIVVNLLATLIFMVVLFCMRKNDAKKGNKINKGSV